MPGCVSSSPFGFHWVDVLAADLQHVLEAAEEAEVAVRGPLAHVAGSEPAVLVIGLGRLLGLLVVTLHQGVAAYADFTRNAVRQILTGLRVYHLDLVARRGVAGRFEAMGRVVVQRAQACADPHLGHAERRQSPERSEYTFAPVGARRGAVHAGGEQAGAQRAQVPGLRLLGIAESLDMRLEAMRDRATFALDQVQHLARVECLGEDLSCTGDHGHQCGFGVAEGVEQGQVAHDRVALGDRHAEGPFFHVADQPVVMHHPLGESRRSGGVHDEHRLVGIHLGGPGSECRVRHRVGLRQGVIPRCRPRVLAVTDDHDPLEPREVGIVHDVALG